MASVDPKLLQKIMKFQLELKRLQTGERRKALEMFKVLGKNISTIISGDELISLSKVKLNKLIASLGDPVSATFESLQKSIDNVNIGIAEIQLKATNDAILASSVISSGVILPSDSSINRLLSDPLIKGGPMSAWWNKQKNDTIFKLSNTVREGVVFGQTNQEIVRKLTGTALTPGVLNLSRNDASSLVHTAIQTVANDVQQSMFAANDDLILSVKWFTALDSHVCPLCIARADKSWKNTPDHEPIGHDISYQIPPIHFNDRCILLPEMEDLGAPTGERASSVGPIKGDITFKEYLKLVPTDQVEDMLGVGRAKLFDDGKITLNQLIDGNGRELSLKQLKQKYL